MKISRLLKILEDLVALKFSDPRGKHGQRFYRNLHKILRAFLLQDGLPLKTRLRALTPSMAVYAKVRIHEQIDSDDVDNCIHFIVLEVARVLLETEYLRLKETDPSKSLFLKILQQTKQNLKSSPDGRMFEALGNVLSTEWNHPVLLKMVQQEHNDSETIPYTAFIESVENSDIVRLRVRMLLESGCVDLANNLISWCVASRMFNNDIYILLQRLDFLHRSGRAEEFHQLCCQISCCTARELLDSAKQGTSRVSIGRSTFLSMSRTFFLLDWMKATDLSCTRELLTHWIVLEYATVKKDRQLSIEAFNKVIALSHDIKQIILFVDVVDAQFGSEFHTFCSELMLQAIRQERHRLDCARLYRRDAEDVRDATENLVSICRIVARIYKHHCQMNLSCTLSCLYLDPTVADFCSLEKEYANLECPPSTEPDPPHHVCESIYRKLLSAVQFLRPDSFAVSSMWSELKPVLVTYMEDEGFRYNNSKERFRSNRKQVRAGKRIGSRNRNIWKGMNSADAEDGFEAKSSPKKERAKVGDRIVKSGRLNSDLADKEPKAGENSNKRKQNCDEECGITSHRGSGVGTASSDEPLSKKLCRLHPKQASDSSGDVAGESGGENSTDSAAVSEYSSGPRPISSSEMRRRSLLGRRYVWNSSASASPASNSNPQKLSSHTAGKSDKETAYQNCNDIGTESELRATTCGCLSLDGSTCSEHCSKVGLNHPCVSTADRLDKNSNLRVESIHASSTTSLNMVAQNGDQGSCSNVVGSKADVEKEKDGNSRQGGWESKFLAYCSSIGDSEVEVENISLATETVATSDLAVSTSDFPVATSDSAVATSTSITSVSCANSSTRVVPCMTAKSGANATLNGLFESFSSPKIAYILESPSSCSSKSSELQTRCPDTSRLVVEGAEPSLNSSVEMVSREVETRRATLDNFGLNGSAIATTGTCLPSIDVVTLNNKDSGLNCASHSKGNFSSDTNSDRKVMLHPTASEVDSCRKFAQSCTNLFAKTTKELSATSHNTCNTLGTSASKSVASKSPCTRKITFSRVQGDILQSSFPFSSSTLDSSSSVTAVVSAVSPAFTCTTEKPMPPPTTTTTRTLSGPFSNETSICRVNEEPVLTNTFSYSHSVASSTSTHSSSASLPVEMSSVAMVTASDELMTSRVVCSCLPVMSVMDEVRSASSVLEPQSAELTDGVTYFMYELAMESVLPITMTTATGAITPDSAAGFQTVTSDEMNQVSASPNDMITSSSNKTYSDDYSAAGDVPASDATLSDATLSDTTLSDATLVASRSVLKMLETIDRTVTCSKTKRHSVAFVQKLKKIFKPESEASSRSPDSSQGSEDIVETSAELNAAKRNDGCEERENENTTAVDVVGTKVVGSLWFVETSGNNALNKDPQTDLSQDDGKTEDERVYRGRASVMKQSLAVGLDYHAGSDYTRQKLSAALNSCYVHHDQILDLRTNSNSILQANAANIEMINVESNSIIPDVQTDVVGQVGKAGLETNSTPNLQLDNVQTDQRSVDGQLVNMSIFNALDNEQQLLVYNRLRQEHERNADTHRHTLAVIRFDDQTTVQVSPTNRFHYERVNHNLRDVLDNSLPCGFDAKTGEGDTTSCDARNGSGLRQKVESVASGLFLDGGRASDGLVKGGESVEESEDVHHKVSGVGKPVSAVQGFVEDIPGEGLEPWRDSCHLEGQGHVGDDSIRARKKLNKGKHPIVEIMGKDRATVVRNSDKVESRGGRKAVKGESPVEEKPSRIHDDSSSVDSDKVACVMCGKLLSLGRSLRTHIIKLHKMDFVDWRAPESGYKCRLCNVQWKMLCVCTCQQEITSGKTVRSEKPSDDSSEHFTSCRTKTARRSIDRKSSLDGSSDCERSVGGQSDDQSTDRSRSAKVRGQKSNDRPNRRQCNTRRSKETKKSGSQKIAAASKSKASNGDNGDGSNNGDIDDVVAEGSSGRRSRKRLICGSKKNTNKSIVKKRNARGLSDNAEKSSVRCRPRKRGFGEGEREKTDESLPSAHHHRRRSDAGEDSSRGNDVEGEAERSCPQKRWRLRDRPKVKTE